MKVEVVVFDWSGVVSDDTEPVYYVNMKICEKYGIPSIPFEKWKEQATLSPREFFKNFGVNDDPEKIFTLYTELFSEAPMRPRMILGVKEVFSFLKSKNKTIVILSSHPEKILKTEIEEYGLGNFISIVLGSVKNKADSIKSLLEDLSMQPDSMLYVGDTVWDIKAAKEAGINSAAVLTGYHSENKLKKENPDLLITRLNELRQFIK